MPSCVLDMITTTNIPKVLYKYRSWSNTWHQKLLKEKKAFFAAFSQFNDPFDGAIPFRYKTDDLTPENIFQKSYELAKRSYPDWSDQKIHEYCFENQKDGKHTDEQFWLAQHESLVQMNAQAFGVFSTSAVRDEYLMWSHYSDSHKGYCIGLDTEVLMASTPLIIGQVTYQDPLPRIDLFAEIEEFIQSVLFTKGLMWEYEEEFRMLLPKGARKEMILPDGVIHSVVIGCKMPEKLRIELVTFILEKYPKAELFQANLATDSFRLVVTPIA